MKMMGCLLDEMKVAQTTMAEMKTASLAEEMADVMVRMMNASLAEMKAVSLAQKMADMKVRMMDCQSAASSAKMTTEVMVRRMGCLSMVVRLMGCLSAASLAKMTGDMLVRLMDFLLAASWAEDEEIKIKIKMRWLSADVMAA
jgi:hypothetical protein